ncbi:DUF4861 family protein [Polaribacter vadi]|uniref:DUF4861 family protein n=1 Tax=Polaribacter vadi TaxID=1774273 RepID=UPI0030EB98B6|tara:strand:+ start:1506 stop:2678 length:1173 start_codon:yes stop_codon:yes gene_type:complete
MSSIKFVLFSLTILICSSCFKETKSKYIVVKNSLTLERSFETVELTKEILNVNNLNNIGIKDVKSNELLLTQLVDLDGDGKMDQLLFQPQLLPTSEKKYEVVEISEEAKPKAEILCYSRFVPERTDDYAWENNKVAFRTFGPTAQKMIEDDVPGGTLSSGIDAWLKKVEYPIINKWYAKNDIRPGAYHEMSPEGLDNFHVGSSRGVGSTAVKKDADYYISKNFINWKTITTGPIRTSFVLDYADWDADGQVISEKKNVSLDYGNNLTRYEIDVTGTNFLSSGLTLHENDGEVTKNVKEGWISYWEPHGDSELGTAIVASAENMVASEYYVTTLQDRSNLYAQLKVTNNKVVFYAGYAWKESGQYPNKSSWENYLKEFSQKINSPLVVVVN